MAGAIIGLNRKTGACLILASGIRRNEEDQVLVVSGFRRSDYFRHPENRLKLLIHNQS
jgi:hypothetical protein